MRLKRLPVPTRLEEGDFQLRRSSELSRCRLQKVARRGHDRLCVSTLGGESDPFTTSSAKRLLQSRVPEASRRCPGDVPAPGGCPGVVHVGALEKRSTWHRVCEPEFPPPSETESRLLCRQTPGKFCMQTAFGVTGSAPRPASRPRRSPESLAQSRRDEFHDCLSIKHDPPRSSPLRLGKVASRVFVRSV